MTPEERAKAVVQHFASMLPPAVRPQLESVIARAITRAVNQALAKSPRQQRAGASSDPKAHGQALVGRTVTIRDSTFHGAGNAYPLPDGLKDGQLVTVLAFDHGYLTVKDQGGKQWQVYTTNIDS